MPPTLSTTAALKADDIIEALLDSRMTDAITKAPWPVISLSIDEVLGKHLEGMVASIGKLKQENTKLAIICDTSTEGN